MNAKDAIIKLRAKQQEMMLEAQEMEQRAELLQSIAECQDPQGGGYRWGVVRTDLSDDGMRMNRIKLICEKSGVEVDAVLVHPPPLTIADGDDDIELREFLSERSEEE